MLEVFTSDPVPAYLDYSKIAVIIQKLGQTTKTNMMRSTFTQQLYLPLLKVIQGKQVPNSDKILASILSSIPPIESSLFSNSQGLQCIQSILQVAVKQKQV